jgi:hypothetical protein
MHSHNNDVRVIELLPHGNYNMTIRFTIVVHKFALTEILDTQEFLNTKLKENQISCAHASVWVACSSLASLCACASDERVVLLLQLLSPSYFRLRCALSYLVNL